MADVRLNKRRARFEAGRRALNIGQLARKARLSRWAVSRALNGHMVSTTTLQKLSEALAASPPVDLGLVDEPTNPLEEN